jgi:ABC-type multidrug transport system ATPase subunit
VIRLDDVRRRYGTSWALAGLSLEVPAGAVAALVGPNGAGKTTALRILATLEAPTAGAAAVDGHDVVAHRRAVRERIGHLGHRSPVYDALTAREHLAFDADARGQGPEEAGLEALPETLDLEPEVRAGRLSRGNRRRLGLARALVGDPPVLLLDEPFASLDPASRGAVADLLARDPDRTVLVASHDVGQAAQLADTLHILRDGTLEGAVPADDPGEATEQARDLLGASP